MPIDPMLFAPIVSVRAQVDYWPDRLRLAWAVLLGREFSLSAYKSDVTFGEPGPTPEAKERT